MKLRTPTRILALGTLLAASRCGSCKATATADAGAATIASTRGPSAPPSPLSLPMAAEHDANGYVYVAGFVAARGVVALTRFDDTGRAQWNADAITALSFSSDAHIDVVPVPRGVVVVWRGIKDGKRTRIARFVTDEGVPTSEPFPIGSSACAVGAALLSIGGKGGSSIVARAVPDGSDKTIFTVPQGRDPALVCGEGKRALVIDESEDDVGVRAIENDKAQPRVTLVGGDDLGDDEMREHEDFTIGDTLGQMVLTEKGHMVLRQYADTVGPRRPLEHVLGSDEDLMAVDGNASHVIAIVSREAGARCDGDVGTDIVAIDVPLPEGKESLVDVAHGDCGRDLGPYWVAPTSEAVYIAWSVRGPRNGNRAPVEALAWSKLGGPLNEVKLSAEEVAFAGCTKTKCAFVALTRPEGTDGMVPGEARVITIP